MALFRCVDCRRGGKNAEMRENAADAAAANLQRGKRDGAATAHFGSHRGKAGATGGSRRRPAVAVIADYDDDGGAERLDHRHVAKMMGAIRDRFQHGARQDVERGAAGMQIEKSIAARKDLADDVVGDLLGDRTGRIARERPVEVQSVDRRRPQARRHGVDVDGRHEDETALDLRGIDLAHQVADGDRPLVLVPVVAAFDDHRRTFAVGDHGERHARHAPGVVVRRVRNHDEADLLSGPVEIDRCEGDAVPGHGRGSREMQGREIAGLAFKAISGSKLAQCG